MRTLFVIFILGVGPWALAAVVDPLEETDRDAITMIVADLTKAWKQSDADAWAAAFSHDADFTVWFGLSLKGRQEIATAHQFIFDTIYANTAFDLSIRQLRFLTDEVAVAHLTGTVTRKQGPASEGPDAVPIVVLQKLDGEWKIVAFQNTPYAVEEFRANGDLKRFKELAGQQVPRQ